MHQLCLRSGLQLDVKRWRRRGAAAGLTLLWLRAQSRAFALDGAGRRGGRAVVVAGIIGLLALAAVDVNDFR